MPDINEKDVEIEAHENLKSFIYKLFHSIKFQIILTFFVFISTLILSRQGNILHKYIEIPISVGIDLFSVVAQALIAMIGFILVFIVLALQFIGLERSRWHTLIRDKVERLNQLTLMCPPDFSEVQKNLLSISRSIEYLYTINSLEIKEEFKQKFDPLVKRLGKINGLHRPGLSMKKKVYLQNVFSLLMSIEETFNKLIVADIGAILLPVDYTIFPKLLFLFFISIILIPIFGGMDLKGIFPDLRLPIIFTFLTLLFILIVETYQVITYLFNNFIEWD